MNSLESRLTELPEPPAPEGLGAGVMARLARLEHDPHIDRAEGRQQVGDRSAPRARWAWPAILLGLVVGLAAQAYGMASASASPDGPFPWPLPSVNPMTLTPALAALAAGLLIYVAGLLGAAGEEDRR